MIVVEPNYDLDIVTTGKILVTNREVKQRYFSASDTEKETFDLNSLIPLIVVQQPQEKGELQQLEIYFKGYCEGENSDITKFIKPEQLHILCTLVHYYKTVKNKQVELCIVERSIEDGGGGNPMYNVWSRIIFNIKFLNNTSDNKICVTHYGKGAESIVIDMNNDDVKKSLKEGFKL